MKALTAVCFTILTSILLLLSILNFAFVPEEIIEGDKQTILIKKPDYVDNNTFLVGLSDEMCNIGCDIMFKFIDTRKEKAELIYYITNNTSDFIALKCEKGDLIFGHGECVSTIKHEGYYNYGLKAANTLSDITFFSLTEASKHSLESAVFFVKIEDLNIIVHSITNLGYDVEIKYSSIISGKYNVPLFSMIPVILYLASVVFLMLSSGREIMIKKMEGYSSVLISRDIAVRTIPIYLLIIIVGIILNIVAGTIIYSAALFEFIKYSVKYIIFLLAMVLVGYLIELSISSMKGDIGQIKGQSPQKGIYYVTIVVKMFFLIFIVFFLSIALRNAIFSYNTYNASKTMLEKTKGYITIPVYSLNKEIDGLEYNYLKFYKLTENEYDGILIDSSNYEIDLVSGKSLCEEYNQDDIIVNRNYLDFNHIYMIDGEILSGDNLNMNYINILLPKSQKQREDILREKYNNAYETQVNIMYYDDTITRIYSYHPGPYDNPLGEIQSPVVIIANDKVVNEQFIYSFITRGYYFIRPQTNNPYEELLPILVQLEINETTPNVAYVKDIFEETIIEWLKMLRIYATQSVLLLTGLLILIVFCTKIYSINYRKQISVMLTSGFSLVCCLYKHLLTIIVSYAICRVLINFGIDLGIEENPWIIPIIMVIDVIITIIIGKAFALNNLNEIVKGAE